MAWTKLSDILEEESSLMLMRLDPASVGRFHDDGFLAFDTVLPEEAIATLHRILTDLINRDQRTARARRKLVWRRQGGLLVHLWRQRSRIRLSLRTPRYDLRRAARALRRVYATGRKPLDGTASAGHVLDRGAIHVPNPSPHPARAVHAAEAAGKANDTAAARRLRLSAGG